MGTNYVKKARTVRLPAITDTQINNFDTGVVSTLGSYLYNVSIFKYPDESYYATQRPSFAIFNAPADGGVTDARGRGAFYWAQLATLFFVNNDTVYSGTYGGGLAQLFGNEGTEKVEIAELGDDLVFLDAEGNEMWYINSGAASTLVTMNGVSPDFDNLPQNDSQELAHGIAVLDQTMYVLDTNGVVYGSAVGDAQDWSSALNKITAEKEEDAGVYIAKHYDNLVIFGRRTIEFMYGAGNPTGSPLSVRQDISYNIGCADPNSVWRNGDDLYFLGIDTSGQIQPYLLREFKLTPIATTSIISYITTSKSLDNVKTMGSGMSSGGVTYYILTGYTLDGNSNIDPIGTFVYNDTTQVWVEWEFAGTEVDNFPLISYTITDDSRIGEGITACGCLLYVVDNYTPYDTEQDAADPYVESGYVGTGYVLAGAGAESNVITMKIRLDNFDNDNRDWKFAHQLRYVGDSTQDSNNMTIRWNDSNNVPNTYVGTRTIDLSSNLNKLTRLGRFKNRSFEFEYSGTEQIRFKGIDLDITEGTH